MIAVREIELTLKDNLGNYEICRRRSQLAAVKRMVIPWHARGRRSRRAVDLAHRAHHDDLVAVGDHTFIHFHLHFEIYIGNNEKSDRSVFKGEGAACV